MENFNKEKCLELLEEKRLIEKKFNTSLENYDSKKYYELMDQLSYVVDYFVWKFSFSNYFELFTNYKNQLINSETFIDEFFFLFNKDKKRIENFDLNSEIIKTLNFNYKCIGLMRFLDNISIQFDLFDPEPSNKLVYHINEEEFEIYFNQIYNRIKSFK